MLPATMKCDCNLDCLNRGSLRHAALPVREDATCGNAVMRTREGIAIARSRGKLKGKQPKLTARQQAELVRMHATGDYTIADLMEVFSIARVTSTASSTAPRRRGRRMLRFRVSAGQRYPLVFRPGLPGPRVGWAGVRQVAPTAVRAECVDRWSPGEG